MKKNIVLFLTLVCIQFSFAQHDEELKKDALKVIELSGATFQLQQTKNQLLKMVPKDKQADFITDFNASLPAVYEKFAKMYMKIYTKEDLKAMIDFYETPVGKKMRANTEEIVIRSQGISQEWMSELQELLTKYRLP
jgi:hypothetical protein